MKNWTLIAAGTFAMLVGVLALNALRLESRQFEVAPNAEAVPDSGAAARRLAHAVRFQTISHQDPEKFPGGEFARLQAYLSDNFPRVRSALRKRQANGHSFFYEWRGTDASLQPILLMAHQDVVPVDPASAAQWRHAPFSGTISEGFVWGRGTLDDKGALMALHEAAEALLAQDFKPRRTVFFAFGHDEEVGGQLGSRKIAQWFAAQAIRLESVLDEGQVVTEGIVAGFDRPIALIGIAEKGYVSLELTVDSEGGHSSMPPPHTAVGLLSAAIARLENNPFPATLSDPVRQQLAFLGPEQAGLRRVVFSNLWLFAPLVKSQMQKAPATNAMLRTTIAPTMLQGGVKENVLPMRARGVVNLRLAPGMSSQEAIRRVEAVIDDARVKIATTGSSPGEPSPVSSTGSDSFNRLHRSVAATFPDAIVAPSLVLGATDTRHFVAIAENVYRFLPARLTREDLARYHGVNERLSIENYADFVRFYMRYLREAAG